MGGSASLQEETPGGRRLAGLALPTAPTYLSLQAV